MRRLAMVLAAVLMSSACVADEPEPVVTAAQERTAAPELRVTGEQEQGAMDWARLSPDGDTVVHDNGNSTCVRAVDATIEHCLDKGDLFSVSRAAWSPDGSRVAITEEHAIGPEPDVWVVDVESGRQTNLTDDGIGPGEVNWSDEVVFPADAVLDGFVSWSEDGERIRFLRRESEATAIMSVPAGGGEPTRLGSIDTAWEELYSVAWAENAIAWFAVPPESIGDEVLVADLRGGEPRKVLDGEYSLLSFSADGEFLLADENDSYSPAVGRAVVVPVRGGDPVPVASGKVRYPTWGPEGHAIAYVEAPGTLRVVGEPGGPPRDLHEESELGPPDADNIEWVAGAMLVTVGETGPVVLRVDG